MYLRLRKWRVWVILNWPGPLSKVCIWHNEEITLVRYAQQSRYQRISGIHLYKYVPVRILRGRLCFRNISPTECEPANWRIIPLYYDVAYGLLFICAGLGIGYFDAYRQNLGRIPVSPFPWDNNTNKLKFCRMSSCFGKTSNWRCLLWQRIR